MGIRALTPYDLPDTPRVESADHARANQKRQQDRGRRRARSTKRDVVEYVER